MKVSTMRLADSLLGVPACFALTVMRRLRQLAGRRRAGKVESIAFVKLAEQGTTVLAHPAFLRAVEMVGRRHVYFVVFEENRHIMDVLDVIPRENVIAIPTSGLFAVLRGALRAARKLRKLRIDAVVDMEFFARSSAVLSFLAGAPCRVGLHECGDGAPYRGDLMTRRIPYPPELHTWRLFKVLVEAIGPESQPLPSPETAAAWPDPELPQLRPGRQELAATTSMLRQATGRRTLPPLILLNPNCSDLMPQRQWPAERYVELARRLLDKYPEVHVAITGAPNERPAAQRLVDEVASERCCCLAGRTTLRELLIVYCLAEVLVTNDSGPAHFAALTPIDVITLFGPETPVLFASPSPRNRVQWLGLHCSPCVSAFNNRLSRCRKNRCMLDISTDQVFEQVCKAYESRR